MTERIFHPQPHGPAGHIKRLSARELYNHISRHGQPLWRHLDPRYTGDWVLFDAPRPKDQPQPSINKLRVQYRCDAPLLLRTLLNAEEECAARVAMLRPGAPYLLRKVQRIIKAYYVLATDSPYASEEA